MPRENAREKAARLLVQGRLTVLHVSDAEIVAACKGDSGPVYRVTYSGGAWACDCPALGAWSHGKAAALVTVVPTAGRSCDLVQSVRLA
jgi:hypothetical protein